MGIRIGWAVLLIALTLGACATPAPTPTPLPTPTAACTPTPFPTATPSSTAMPAPTAAATPLPTSVFQPVFDGDAEFVIGIPIDKTPVADAAETADRLRRIYRDELLSLAERINQAVIDGDLPQLTKGSEVVFTFSDISVIGEAEKVGAIVVSDGRAWQVNPEGEISLWASEGVSLCTDCSHFVEGGQQFILKQGPKYFLITGTDATRLVHKLVEVDVNGKPIEGGQEKTALLIKALPNAEAGKGILQIGGVAFLEIPAGMQLKFDGFFNPVDGLVEFKNPNGEVIASWDPLKGEWKTGGPDQVFAPEPTVTPEAIAIPDLINQDNYLGFMENVDWDSNTIDTRVVQQEAETGKEVAFWPFEIDGKVVFSARKVVLDANGSPRNKWAFDLPVGTRLRAPFSGTLKFLGTSTGEVVVQVEDEDGKRVVFDFSSWEGVDFEVVPETQEIVAGQAILVTNEGLQKISKIGNLKPSLDPPATTVMGISVVSQGRYGVDFDWLKDWTSDKVVY